MLDVAFARSFFPALASGWALFDNTGGTVVPHPVAERVSHYLARYGMQIGAGYAPSQEASALVAAGREAAARLIGAEPDEVILSGSTTLNTLLLAQAIGPWFQPGDEIVVTNLDHEANIGAWRRLEARGVVLREWRFDPASFELELEALDAVLSERTRLVCFTQCANMVGLIYDAARVVDRVHRAGALALVDGVAFAPHRKVDVHALGTDFYLVSLYKILGPHVGMLYGQKRHWLRARNLNHFFFGDDEVPYKLQPGNVNHELTAGLAGIADYLDALYYHHFAEEAEPELRQRAVFELFERHEERLVAPLVAFLAGHPRARLLGPPEASRERRVAIVAFVPEGRHPREVAEALAAEEIAVRWGHFYAYRAIRELGLLDQGGVVRLSLAHYNTEAEVSRLIEALGRVL